MPHVCPLCSKPTDSVEHITEQFLLKMIRDEHPDWVDQNGLCPRCIDYYRKLDKVESNMLDEVV